MEKHHLLSLSLMMFFFFPLVYISQYNYPSGDDYHALLQARKLGALEAAKWWYFNWTGRYTSFFLQSLFASHAGWLTIYKIVPPALFLAGFSSVFYFFRNFFGRGLSNKALFSFSAGMYVFLVGLTPDAATGFYWLPTSVQYLGAVFISLLILSLYIKLHRAINFSAKVMLSFLVVLLIAFLAGLNEISTLFLITIFSSINFFYFIKFKRLHTWSLMFLAFSVLFALISFLSPGNAIRAQQAGTEIHFIKILAGAVGATFYLAVELLSTTPLLLASIVYLVFLDFNRDKLGEPFSFMSGVRWHWVLAALFCAVTATNVLLFIATDVNSLVYRIKNVYVYSIVLIWLFFLTSLYVDLAAKKIKFNIPTWATGLLTIFILFFLLTGFELKLSRKNIIPSSNVAQQAFSTIKTKSVYTNAYLDVASGRAKRFCLQNEERMKQLRDTKGDAVDISLYSYVPETLFIQDVNHPFGAPAAMSMALSGEVKHLRYMETGPPVTLKEKF